MQTYSNIELRVEDQDQLKIKREQLDREGWCYTVSKDLRGYPVIRISVMIDSNDPIGTYRRA